jgi:hypothetical protein
MKGEPPLEEYLPPPFPQVGDFVDVYGDVEIGLADGLHTLVITKISGGHSQWFYDDPFDCATQDGEKDNIQIFPSEIIDWRKNP